MAAACPDCAPVRAARAAIQDDPAFWTYVLGTTLPFVLIGHSKTFTRYNERMLAPFLAFVAKHPDRFRFGTFRDFDPEAYRAPLRAA